jgi:hypothetical protein
MKICKFAFVAASGLVLSMAGATGFAAACPATNALVVCAPIDIQVRSNTSTIERDVPADQSTTMVDARQL